MDLAHDLASVVSVLVLLSQLGLIAWIKWSIERIAETAAAKAEVTVIEQLEEHKIDRHAHPEAADHYHGSMSVKLDLLLAKSGQLEVKLEKLITEHETIKGTALCVAATNGGKGR